MNVKLLQNDIKKLLIDKGMKQQDLANRLGKSKQATSKLLSQNGYTLDTLERIADALECELVINFVDKKNKENIESIE